MFTGRLGIHTGIVNHGGEAADMKMEGKTRSFGIGEFGLITLLEGQAIILHPYLHCRDMQFEWFMKDLMKLSIRVNVAIERADEVVPIAMDWLASEG